MNKKLKSNGNVHCYGGNGSGQARDYSGWDAVYGISMDLNCSEGYYPENHTCNANTTYCPILQ